MNIKIFLVVFFIGVIVLMILGIANPAAFGQSCGACPSASSENASGSQPGSGSNASSGGNSDKSVKEMSMTRHGPSSEGQTPTTLPPYSSQNQKQNRKNIRPNGKEKSLLTDESSNPLMMRAEIQHEVQKFIERPNMQQDESFDYASLDLLKGKFQKNIEKFKLSNGPYGPIEMFRQTFKKKKANTNKKKPNNAHFVKRSK